MLHINRIRWISMVSVAYMIAAFIWWVVLLARRNDEVFQLRIEKEQLSWQLQHGHGLDAVRFQKTGVYQQLLQDYQKHRRMIVGEGTVSLLGFGIILLLIHLAYQRELATVHQRRNFMLSITHELKTPLASIALVLDTFIKRQLEFEKIQQLAEKGRKECQRLTELVSNLLLSTRLDAPYIPNLEEINVVPFTEDIVQRFRLRYPNVPLEVIYSEVPILRAEKLGLISVFMNLLENAVKYSPKNPQIRLSYRYDKEQFIFEVADQGIGIPLKERQKVFERFYRVGSEETRMTKGTGLGLFIVKQIVKVHQGKIQILENQPCGTIIRITLPN